MNTSGTLARQLTDGLAAMQLSLPSDAPARLVGYLRLLAKWNRAYNLTATRRMEQMVPRHLLDSLAVLPYLTGGTLADLGSGAGLPGIPLAIARPDLRVTLVERNGKKARFLREAARSLPLANVACEHARAQDVQMHFDTVTTRAFASLAAMLAAGGHLLSRDGRWLALKGHLEAAEIAAVPSGFRVRGVHPLTVPGASGPRCVVEIVRAGRETDARW